MLFQSELSRLLAVLIFYPLMALIFIFIAVRILIRNRKRLNITFSMFYFSVAIGVALNAVYALLQEELIVLILHYSSITFVGLSLIFLLTTNRILIQSTSVYESKKQVKQIMIYIVFLLGAFIFLPFDGAIINASTEWRPIWNIFLYGYITAVHTAFAVIPILYTSFKILTKMESKPLRKKWALFIVGIIGLMLSMYLTFLSNYLNIEIIRLIATFYAISTVIWAIMIYYGIGKAL